MSEFYVKRRVEKTRKEHRCYDCGKIIPMGSTCTDSCTVYEHQFLHGYFCSDCLKVPPPKTEPLPFEPTPEELEAEE